MTTGDENSRLLSNFRRGASSDDNVAVGQAAGQRDELLGVERRSACVVADKRLVRSEGGRRGGRRGGHNSGGGERGGERGAPRQPRRALVAPDHTKRVAAQRAARRGTGPRRGSNTSAARAWYAVNRRQHFSRLSTGSGHRGQRASEDRHKSRKEANSTPVSRRGGPAEGKKPRCVRQGKGYDLARHDNLVNLKIFLCRVTHALYCTIRYSTNTVATVF